MDDDDVLLFIGDAPEERELTPSEVEWAEACVRSLEVRGPRPVIDEVLERFERWVGFVASGEPEKVVEEIPQKLRSAKPQMYEGPAASYELRIVGIACVLAYVRANYAGPGKTTTTTSCSTLEFENAREALSVCGEAVSPFIAVPEVLVIARACCSEGIWGARAATLHARALVRGGDEELWEECERCYEQEEVTALTELERGLSEHHFDKKDRGKARFEKARRLSGLEVGVAGALGKRTKFQRKSLPQLRLETRSRFSTEEKVRFDTKSNVPLNEDSVLLENIRFDDGISNGNDDLSPLQQAVALALCLDVRNSNPDDGLTAEEMRPYVAHVIANPANPLVHATALWQRCRLESTSVYSADRAALQLEALVSERPSGDLSLAFAVDYPAVWEAKRELATAMMGLGATLTAASYFEDLEDWDSLVACYAAAGRRHDALRVLEEDAPRTPSLWCALGELTDDPKALEKAWDLNRHARAARLLGKRAARDGDWATAQRWYDACTRAAPRHAAAWFDLGVACMVEEKWEPAARAFSRTVCRADDADAWANLAAVRLRLNEPRQALAALEAAIRLRPEDFRLWENASRVSVKLGEMGRAVHALHRVADFRRPVKSYLDQLALVAVSSDFDKTAFRNLLDRLEKEASSTDPDAPKLYGTLALRAKSKDHERHLRMKQVRAHTNLGLREGALNAAEALLSAHRGEEIDSAAARSLVRALATRLDDDDAIRALLSTS